VLLEHCAARPALQIAQTLRTAVAASASSGRTARSTSASASASSTSRTRRRRSPPCCPLPTPPATWPRTRAATACRSIARQQRSRDAPRRDGMGQPAAPALGRATASACIAQPVHGTRGDNQTRPTPSSCCGCATRTTSSSRRPSSYPPPSATT
jgi:hypothetical protein